MICFYNLPVYFFRCFSRFAPFGGIFWYFFLWKEHLLPNTRSFPSANPKSNGGGGKLLKLEFLLHFTWKWCSLSTEQHKRWLMLLKMCWNKFIIILYFASDRCYVYAYTPDGKIHSAFHLKYILAENRSWRKLMTNERYSWHEFREWASLSPSRSLCLIYVARLCMSKFLFVIFSISPFSSFYKL